jgi:hypothetical protein
VQLQRDQLARLLDLGEVDDPQGFEWMRCMRYYSAATDVALDRVPEWCPTPRKMVEVCVSQILMS